MNGQWLGNFMKVSKAEEDLVEGMCLNALGREGGREGGKGARLND